MGRSLRWDRAGGSGEKFVWVTYGKSPRQPPDDLTPEQRAARDSERARLMAEFTAKKTAASNHNFLLDRSTWNPPSGASARCLGVDVDRRPDYTQPQPRLSRSRQWPKAIRERRFGKSEARKQPDRAPEL